MTSAPLLTDHVIGYRAWRRRGSVLTPLMVGAPPWAPGENVATCVSSHHRAPATGCRCGFNAYHELQRADGPIVGAVRARGEIEVHAEGFRAERAEVIAIGHTPLGRRGARRLGAEYDVPVVPLRRLRAVAEAVGGPVPERLRPPPRSREARLYATVTGNFAAVYIVTMAAVHPGWWWAQLGAFLILQEKGRRAWRWAVTRRWRR